MTDDVSRLPVAAISALHRGNKTEAIKIVRRERGIELKLAKDTVEAYLRGQPACRRGLPPSRGRRAGSALRWLISTVAVVLAYVYFSAR